MLPRVSSAQFNSFSRRVLIGLVLAYVGLILIGPLAALLFEMWNLSPSIVLSELLTERSLEPFARSLLLTGIVLVVNAVVGVGGAIVITRGKFFGVRILGGLVDLPLAVSPVIIGLGFLLILGRDGLFGDLLDEWGVQLTYSFSALVIATLFVTLPYTVREVAYVLEELGTGEEDAASVMGASSWQRFSRITLPNIRLGLGYGLLMTSARSLGEFGAVLILGGSISGSTQTATTFIHDAMEQRNDAGAFGMAALLCAISICLLATLEKFKQRLIKEQES